MRVFVTGATAGLGQHLVPGLEGFRAWVSG